MLDRDEFERRYAERSGITRNELRNLGRVAIPCDCNKEACAGWQIMTVELCSDDTFLGTVISHGVAAIAMGTEGKLIEQAYLLGRSDGIMMAAKKYRGGWWR